MTILSDFDTLFQNNNDTCNHHGNIRTPVQSKHPICGWDLWNKEQRESFNYVLYVWKEK